MKRAFVQMDSLGYGRGGAMTRSTLVCARCGGPVALGRCSTCRLAMDQMRDHARRVLLSWLAVLGAVLAVLIVSMTQARAFAA